jgi:hypothetical protein
VPPESLVPERLHKQRARSVAENARLAAAKRSTDVEAEPPATLAAPGTRGGDLTELDGWFQTPRRYSYVIGY